MTDYQRNKDKYEGVKVGYECEVVAEVDLCEDVVANGGEKEEKCADGVNSERLEGEVAVEGEDGLAPEEDEGGLMQLLDAVVDEADGGPKGTVEVSKEEDDLRFAGLEAGGVLVLLLVVGEEALAGRRGVGDRCILEGSSQEDKRSRPPKRD